MDLPRKPGIHLAIPAQDPVRPDQAGRVEDDPRPPGIDLQKGPGLDEDAPLPRLLDVAVGVLVGDRHGEPVAQLVDRLVDRSGVGELGEDDELDVEERLVADDRAIDHAQQLPDPRRQIASRSRGQGRSVWQAAA